MKKGFLVLFAVSCVLALACGSAQASGGIDRSFGVNGVAEPPQLQGYSEQNVLGADVAPDGHVYLLMTAGCGYSCETDLRLVRLTAGGLPDSTYGSGAGGVLLARLPSFFGLAASFAVDSEGRPVVAFRAPEGAILERLTRDGAPDPGFGDGGSVVMSGLGEGDHPGFLGLNARGITVLVSKGWGEASSNLEMLRYSVGGMPDRSFGDDGRVSAGFKGGPVRRFATLSDGSYLLVTRSPGRRHQHPELHRFGPLGKLDRGFERRANRQIAQLPLSADGRPRRGLAILPRRDGKVDLFATTKSGGILLRFSHAGGLVKRFGQGGYRSQVSGVAAAALAPSGLTFAVAGVSELSQQAVAEWLLPSGRVLRDAGGRRGTVLPGSGPATAIVFMQGSRPVVYLPNVPRCSRGFCSPHPVLIRFKATPSPQHPHARR